ncbi:MAG: 3-phosphoshikimate 1-carboxyvinyltransferase [Lachnospiraceae bacterium]|nr:3-phosphoshikimate 1-carboxyvinyltransferase [Lachnospiraceae bacterium]MDD7326761.1 3-phosphoshikimate 1-carboxyvinyltransferase [Lachnospiraceae bacterium]MDY2758919.1 3-phosphoshikimate 1-carboxyvinyltransferase [Lachnospiraceae bacterium]
MHRKKHLRGEIRVPGDKSISHRGIMLGSLAEGDTHLHGFLEGADCLSSIACFQKMGIEIERDGSNVTIHGKGLHGLHQPDGILDAGNSGTTTRLMSGILAGQDFSSTITGDDSLRTRPMKRVITPLSEMGAGIDSDNGCLPMTVTGGHLHGIDYISPVASAQVKSCVLFAGLYADGKTSVTEPAISRNHTELMLRGFGASVKTDEEKHYVEVEPEPVLHGQDIIVPGDISSAAYFLVAGLICEDADILIKNVNINHTRAGILKVIEDMGGNISYIDRRTVSGEEVADINVRTSSLHGTTVEGDIIPTLIDELPVIAVMAAYADGTTVIRDAAELKVKESDRIATVTENLRAMGADITPTPDGFVINGGRPLHGASIHTHKDHRIAMSFAVAALNADGETVPDSEECVEISYPGFFHDLAALRA